MMAKVLFVISVQLYVFIDFDINRIQSILVNIGYYFF